MAKGRRGHYAGRGHEMIPGGMTHGGPGSSMSPETVQELLRQELFGDKNPSRGNNKDQCEKLLAASEQSEKREIFMFIANILGGDNEFKKNYNTEAADSYLVFLLGDFCTKRGVNNLPVSIHKTKKAIMSRKIKMSLSKQREDEKEEMRTTQLIRLLSALNEGNGVDYDIQYRLYHHNYNSSGFFVFEIIKPKEKISALFVSNDYQEFVVLGKDDLKARKIG